MLSAPRSGYLAAHVSIPIYIPHPHSGTDGVTITRVFVAVPIENLKEQVPKAFSEGNEQVEGIAVVWCYEFQTATPLFGKKTIKTFYKTHRIPLAEFHDNIDRDGGLAIPTLSERFSLFSSTGEDVNIVPDGWESSDPRRLHIERIGYFTRLLGKATLYIGTYHEESELSSTISADPLPVEYEKQFVMSGWREIVLPDFGR